MICESIIYSVLIMVDFLIKNAVPIVKAFVSSVLLLILSGSALNEYFDRVIQNNYYMNPCDTA